MKKYGSVSKPAATKGGKGGKSKGGKSKGKGGKSKGGKSKGKGC